MTTALEITDTAWLTLKGTGKALPKPFEKRIELGEYAVDGLLHLDDPTLKFRDVAAGGRLTLRIGREDACDVVYGRDVIGWLPRREGTVFVKLMRGGKRLFATPVRMASDELEPTMTVRVEMEEF